MATKPPTRFWVISNYQSFWKMIFSTPMTVSVSNSLAHLDRPAKRLSTDWNNGLNVVNSETMVSCDGHREVCRKSSPWTTSTSVSIAEMPTCWNTSATDSWTKFQGPPMALSSLPISPSKPQKDTPRMVLPNFQKLGEVQASSPKIDISLFLGYKHGTTM